MFLDALGLEWEYEKEGYQDTGSYLVHEKDRVHEIVRPSLEAGNGMRYLPDFEVKVPGVGRVFVEVKSSWQEQWEEHANAGDDLLWLMGWHRELISAPADCLVMLSGNPPDPDEVFKGRAYTWCTFNRKGPGWALFPLSFSYQGGDRDLRNLGYDGPDAERWERQQDSIAFTTSYDDFLANGKPSKLDYVFHNFGTSHDDCRADDDQDSVRAALAQARGKRFEFGEKWKV